jgi:4,5-dihydroxyphthalate decarboxylase
MEPGADLTELVATGALAAGVGLTASQPGLEPLIARPEEAGFEALAERGLYPINHLLVVKDELLDAHPDLAADLFATYAEAKNRYVERLRRGEIEDPTPADRMYQRVMAITGADPMPYGIAPSRAMIEQLIRHAVSQRILDQPVSAESVFAPGTGDLTAQA